MLFNTKEAKLTIKNGEIDYITFGKGKRALVMIQGLNTNGIRGSGLSLAFMYRIFAKDFTVYLFDRRPNFTDKTTVRELANDIAESMDILGISNACVLGVSQGGMIAQYLAIDRPDLVEKLVLAVTLSRNNDTVISTINNWIALTKKFNKVSILMDAYSVFAAKMSKIKNPINDVGVSDVYGIDEPEALIKILHSRLLEKKK